ncbi:hypothetical protein A2737_01585 [Candidatus Nomurabacteria bacterium RIFCSPHIGHO2_01_FULL_41_71]|nr:MAG: hypothetical protein A2737_01585 [Candidatus Nomurabacteria bacterium RIFCSPHIGHO2_01_FULL_41_71]OGI89164.1 MAG: hypothetical protein A3B01_01630 [Candidatus Nomurabacteria bacterium RIFCSPLOWO2_01_FULL_41_52b]
MTTLTQATSGQLKQIHRVGSDAVEKVLAEFGLDKDGAQRVHARGDEFAEAIRVATIASLNDLSVTDKFKDEEVESTYGYLSGYTKPNGLTTQCNRLRELFSGLGFANLDLLGSIEKGEVALPMNTEGWFAILNWIKNPTIFGATYGEALQKVLDTIKTTRNGKFYNYRDGQLGPERLRQSKHTEKFFRELAEAQGNPDILIVAAQFGIRHRGRSVRRAREVIVSTSGEFGLGAFAVGIMILTHPERLMNYDDLWIDCAGDEFDDPDSDVRFVHAPCFDFNGGEVWFGTNTVGYADENYGSASGVVPQS